MSLPTKKYLKRQFMDHKIPNLQKSLHGSNNKNDTKNENAHYQPFMCARTKKSAVMTYQADRQ